MLNNYLCVTFYHNDVLVCDVQACNVTYKSMYGTPFFRFKFQRKLLNSDKLILSYI